MFNWFPYTNFHNLNLDWILKKLKDIPTKVSQLENDAGYVTSASAGIITSVNGQTGDVVLNASDVGAADASAGIPDGGTSGQVLAKASNDDLDVEWKTLAASDVGAAPAAAGIPSGGTTGQLLAKESDDDLDVHWVDLPAADDTVYTDNITQLLGGGTFAQSCFKKHGQVTFSARFSGGSATGVGSFFQLPDGFRPPMPFDVVAFANITGNWVTTYATVSTAGVISIAHSSQALTALGCSGSFQA